MLAKRSSPQEHMDMIFSKRFRGEAMRVVKMAVISRALTIILTMIFSSLFQNYDTSNIISNQHDLYKGKMDSFAKFMLDGFANWDAVYFTWIADKGYSYEQYHAFFPLLPMLMTLLSRSLFFPLTHFLSDRSVILLSGVLISNLCFVGAAVALYLLGVLVLDDRKLAWGASLLFCFCPSSIFMSAIYTESIFAFLSFSGFCMFFLDMFWQSALLFSMAAAVRSNAMVYCGFFVYHALRRTCKANIIGIPALVSTYISTVFLSAIVMVPYGLFQYYGYKLYCTGGMMRPWCDALLPNLYDFVQKEYWNVGFLRYYTISQIPNFILALPVISISVYGIFSYASSDFISFFTAQALSWESLYPKGELSEAVHEPEGKKPSSYFSRKAAVIIYLWLFLLLVGTFIMHIQVITRFFSSMPAFFWFSSRLIHEKRMWRNIILSYCGIYFFMGPLFFANFYPWT